MTLPLNTKFKRNAVHDRRIERLAHLCRNNAPLYVIANECWLYLHSYYGGKVRALWALLYESAQSAWWNFKFELRVWYWRLGGKDVDEKIYEWVSDEERRIL